MREAHGDNQVRSPTSGSLTVLGHEHRRILTPHSEVSDRDGNAGVLAGRVDEPMVLNVSRRGFGPYQCGFHRPVSPTARKRWEVS